jgi:predicted RNA-binding Zn ribbon-like protein
MAKQEAPGELELVRQFVNSLDVDEDTDEFATTDSLASWLQAHDLEGGATSPSETDRRRAVELREALRGLLFSNMGEPLESDTVTTLDRLGNDVRLHVRFDDSGGASLAPGSVGVDSALGSVLAIVYRSMTEGTWPRLKICRADDCQWAFYDRSRNRSGTWCSMAVCGNREKARTYRHRHGKAEAGAGS